VDDVIQLLRNRFGSANQAERYRAELRALRRRKGDSLQAVYQEVRRLMALAFPAQSGSLWEVMARDSYLDALSDPAMRTRVLEKDPATLDETLKLACRLEAISRSVPDDAYDELGRRKDRLARGAVPVDETRAAEASRRVDRLESALKDYRRELDQVRQENAQLRRDLRDVTQRGRQPPPEATAAGNQGQRLSSSGQSALDSTPLVPSTPPPTSGGRSRASATAAVRLVTWSRTVRPAGVVHEGPNGRSSRKPTLSWTFAVRATVVFWIRGVKSP